MSGDSHLTMHPCPRCGSVGVVETADNRWETCPLCGGDKQVSNFKLVEWELHKGHEPAVPDTERDFSKLADSSSPPPPGSKP